MKVTHGVRKKIKEKKELFEKRRAEAFRQFMRAHFSDSFYQDTLVTTLGKN
jgi:hypothetical protein